jgi:MYXO-CTERM domain-containing protein
MTHRSMKGTVAATAASLALAALLSSTPSFAQTSTDPNRTDPNQTTTRNDDRRGPDAGWLGLIGLFGLMGLRRRQTREEEYRREPRGAHA